MPDQNVQAVLVSGDLMMASRFSAAAARQGAAAVSVSGAEPLARLLQQTAPTLVVVDLSCAGGDLAAIVDCIGRSLGRPQPAIVAFGPHVQPAALDAARQAGCQQVLTRGQFNAQLDDLLRRCHHPGAWA